MVTMPPTSPSRRWMSLFRGFTSLLISLPNLSPSWALSTANPWSPMVPERMILSPTRRLLSSVHLAVKSFRYCFTTARLFSNAACSFAHARHVHDASAQGALLNDFGVARNDAHFRFEAGLPHARQNPLQIRHWLSLPPK